MKVKSEREVTQSCPSFQDPMYFSLPGSSVLGIFQARVLEWVVIALSDSLLTRLQMLNKVRNISYIMGQCLVLISKQ